MFKLLRSKAKIFYWIIAASFILFIFLTWGMDLTSQSNQPTASGSEVGSVNGYAISAREWDQSLQAYLGQIRQQNQDRPMTANQRANAAKVVWDQLVRDRIVQAEVDRLGLTANPDEIVYKLKNDPPQELLANYRDESGNPDMGAYLAALANPGTDWRGVENYLRAILPRQKLQQMIVSGAAVTEPELKEAFQKQAGRAVAEYVGVLFADIEDDYEPTDEDVQAYYDARTGLYLSQPRAQVKVVSWPKTPTEQDSTEVRKLAATIKTEILAGEIDFAEAASFYSQDGSSESGGDLGTFDRERMVAPFTETAFSLPPGQISDPVATQFGYHLIEVIEQIEEEGEISQVHARHILLKIEPGDSTLVNLYSQAEDFRNQVDSATFLSRATADSLNLADPEPFPEGRDIPELTNSLEGSQFAHRAKAGTISPIFENQDSFYVVFVEEKLPEEPAALETVRSKIVLKLKEEHKQELAAAKLSPAVAAIREGREFSDVAEEFGLTYALTDTFTSTANLSNIGFGTPFNAVALEVEEGTLVPEVQTRRGLFALRTLWKDSLSEADYLAQRESLRKMLLDRKQRDLMQTWYDEQMASADISDFRDARRLGSG